LASLTPSQEFVTVIAKRFRARWDEAAQKSSAQRAALKLETAAIEKKITALLDRIIESESPTVISAYERKVDDLERQKLVMQEKTARCGTVARGYDESFRTALEFFANPLTLWEKGTFEDKRIVLKLTLSDQLKYDWESGVRTAELSFPFKMLGSYSDREKLMAESEGFEPSDPVTQIGSLANYWFQPLTHDSARARL
jgi:site-specific DNA recombinase